MMSELISKNKAITALVFSEETKDIKCEDMKKVLNVLKKLPSAETELSNNSPKLDNKNGELISRQDAIEAIHEDADWLAAQGSDWQVERMERDKSILMSLPSAEKAQLSGEDATFDCISRKDAITAIFDLCDEADTDNPHVDAIEEVLGNLPSASTDLSTFSDKLWKIAYERGKAEGRKKGKWILVTDNLGQRFECDKCGEWRYHQGQNFCSHCGSRNIEEGESDDN